MMESYEPTPKTYELTVDDVRRSVQETVDRLAPHEDMMDDHDKQFLAERRAFLEDQEALQDFVDRCNAINRAQLEMEAGF